MSDIVWKSKESEDEFVRLSTEFILKQAHRAIAQKGFFNLVISGGKTPLKIFRALAGRDEDWKRWFLFWADERCYPTDHFERNDFQAFRLWLDHIQIPRENIFSIPAELGPKKGAKEYSKKIDKIQSFDLSLLGLGGDGHTASLFPENLSLNQNDTRSVIGVQNSPKPPAKRVSLNYSTLLKSITVAFLLNSHGKENALQALKNHERIPGSFIKGKEETVIFHLNETSS